MTFPTAHSSIYRNEDGEVLGWDNNYDDGPDVDDYYSHQDNEPPEPKDTAQCIAWNMHFSDGDGTEVDDIYECEYCSGLYMLDFTNDQHFEVTKEQFDILKTRETPRQVIAWEVENEGPNMGDQARSEYYDEWARAYDRQETTLDWEVFLDTLH